MHMNRLNKLKIVYSITLLFYLICCWIFANFIAKYVQNESILIGIIIVLSFFFIVYFGAFSFESMSAKRLDKEKKREREIMRNEW